MKADSRAFSYLLAHVRDKDADQQTVLMVQVENEVGYLGRGRDRSAIANKQFEGAVPATLVRQLRDRSTALSPELASHFNPRCGSWKEVFGDAADEVFMASNYASFIEQVTAAGKRSYALPTYVNAQLPAPSERAGEYPSGGPHPYYLEVYRAAAPSIDLYSPDIYWPNFEYWVQRYKRAGNPVFIPEARIESSPFNAFYAYGEAGAFGFCPFGIEVPADRAAARPAIAQTFGALNDLSDMLIPAQAAGKTRGLVLHADSPRPTQTVALGGYLFEATLSRSWPAKTLLTDNDAMTIIQSGRDEFLSPDADSRFPSGAIRIWMSGLVVSGWWTRYRGLMGSGPWCGD